MKTVTVDELVANIEDHLEAAKRGETLMVTKDGENVANIVPPEGDELEVIRHDPALRLQDFEPGPRPERLDPDSGETLTATHDGYAVATFAPADLKIRPAEPGKYLRDFNPPPRPANLEIGAADILIEDREYERSGKKFGA